VRCVPEFGAPHCSTPCRPDHDHYHYHYHDHQLSLINCRPSLSLLLLRVASRRVILYCIVSYCIGSGNTRGVGIAQDQIDGVSKEPVHVDLPGGIDRNRPLGGGDPHPVVHHDHHGRQEPAQAPAVLQGVPRQCLVDLAGVVQDHHLEPDAPHRGRKRRWGGRRRTVLVVVAGAGGGGTRVLSVQDGGLHPVGEPVEFQGVGGSLGSLGGGCGGAESHQVVGQRQVEGDDEVQRRSHDVAPALHPDGVSDDVAPAGNDLFVVIVVFVVIRIGIGIGIGIVIGIIIIITVVIVIIIAIIIVIIIAIIFIIIIAIIIIGSIVITSVAVFRC